MNKAMIIGNLTRDPELKTTTNGTQVVNFGVATSYKYKEQETTEFHNVVAFGKLAEIIAQYLQKGKKVYIEGRLQTREWEGTDGVKKYRTEIIANEMEMLSPKEGAKRNEPSRENIDIDQIPF